MKTSIAVPTATSLITTAALLGGALAPPVFAQDTSRGLAVKSEPLMNKSCHRAFRRDLTKLRTEGAGIWEYYQVHRKAEQVMYDQLRWLLADPNAQDAIPQLEQGAAQSLATFRPLVTKERDKAYSHLNKFEARYQNKDSGCLGKEGRKTFTMGVRYWRAGLKGIYKAHEHLFGVNFAVQTAQSEQAGTSMQNAQVAMSSVEENVDNADKQFDKLLGR